MKKRISWLDTIRSFAIILVIIYHTFTANLPAGFFGVDLLFLLSGFLLTGSMLDRVAEEGDFDPWAFLKHRFLRLFPSLLVMLLVSLFFLSRSNPDFSVDIGRQTLAVVGFSSNWYEMAAGASYEGQFIPHVFLHTWSLALELHFYLLWTLVFGQLVSRQRKQRLRRQEERGEGGAIADSHLNLRMASQLRTKLALVSLLGFVVTLVISQLGLKQGWSDSILYFADWTRFMPFYLGSLLAALSGRHHVARGFGKRAKRASAPALYLVMALAAIAFVVLCLRLSYTNPATYKYGFLLASLLSLVLVYTARALSIRLKDSREPAFFSFFAEISYELYLFHWPLYVLFSYQWPHGKATALALGLAFLLALFSRYAWTPLFLTAFAAPAGPAVGPAYAEPTYGGSPSADPDVFAGPDAEETAPGGAPKEGPSKGKKRASGLVVAVVAAMTLVLGIQVSRKAPLLLSVQSRLWADGIQQTFDQAQSAFDQVQMVKEKEEKERRAKEEIQAKGVTVIGDSVALGMRDALMKEIPNCNVNAKVSRFLHQGEAVMKSMDQNGQLKKNVIIALGNNVYPNFKASSEQLVQSLPKGSRILFVTPYQRGLEASSDVEKYAAWLPSFAEKYPFVEVVDWNKLGKENPDFFAHTDGVHFYESPPASQAYVNLIKEGLDKLAGDPAKGE